MMNLRQKLRASHIKRWHIVETTKQQSVAEHSFNVWLICEEMSAILKFDPSTRLIVAEYALHHDLPEVFIGDLPTSMKNIYRNSRSEIDELTESLDPKSTTNNRVANNVVKLADNLEAAMFIALHGVGSHAKSVRKLIEESVLQSLEKMVGHPNYAELSIMVWGMLKWDTNNDDMKGIV
jgi:5'-deoxynucleotidase